MIESELNARVAKGANILPLSGVPSILNPVPVFHLDMKQAASGAGVGAARRVGWWYMVIGGVEPGVAMLQELNGEPRFAGITHGTLAKRFYGACMLADEHFGAENLELEPRIFDMPALDVIALWLHGKSQYFIPLMDGNPPGSAAFSIVSDIEGRIKAAIDHRSSRVLIQRIPGSPTN